MPISYDPMLVMLSIFVSIVGSLTGLAVTAGYDPSERRTFAASLFKGAIIIGGSIWAMHFVAMLAVRLPVIISYGFVDTVLSLYIAVLGTGLGLFIVSKRRLGIISVPIGGLLMGIAIGGMHYLGMSAMRGCGITYEPVGVIASVVIAIAASTIALWFTFRKRGPLETLFGGLVLGLAIPSMHYAAMAATYFRALPASSITIEPLLSQDTLGFAIATTSFIICGIFLLMFFSLAMGEDARRPRRG